MANRFVLPILGEKRTGAVDCCHYKPYCDSIFQQDHMIKTDTNELFMVLECQEAVIMAELISITSAAEGIAN